MKRNIINTALCLILAVLVGSCEKDGLMTYETPPDVYFSALANNYEPDHQIYQKFNFERGDRADSVINMVLIRIAGEIKDYDRDVNVIAVDAPEDTNHSSAIEGIHYRILEAYVPAGRAYGYIYVRTYNAKRPNAEEVRLTLKLEANEHFGIKFDSIINNTTERKKRSMLHYPIFISGVILTKPPMWSMTQVLNLLGDYSEAKYNLLMSTDISGLGAAYWEGIESVGGRKVSAADIPPFAERMRHYLAKRFVGPPNGLPGGPVFEDDGRTLMDVPGWTTLIPRYQ